MPLSPEKEFHFDPVWEQGVPSVFMTAMKVWGPLIAGGLLSVLLLILLVLI